MEQDFSDFSKHFHLLKNKFLLFFSKDQMFIDFFHPHQPSRDFETKEMVFTLLKVTDVDGENFILKNGRYTLKCHLNDKELIVSHGVVAEHRTENSIHLETPINYNNMKLYYTYLFGVFENPNPSEDSDSMLIDSTSRDSNFIFRNSRLNLLETSMNREVIEKTYYPFLKNCGFYPINSKEDDKDDEDDLYYKCLECGFNEIQMQYLFYNNEKGEIFPIKALEKLISKFK